jgi:pimeloyl-ACP methyl ester carboxylesterase
MPTVRTADGVNLSYHALGEGRVQVLFMAGRGGAGSGHSWKEVVKHLDVTGLRLTLADLPGHCQSEKATAGFTTERFAEDVFDVADHVGGRQSCGGWLQYERQMGAVDVLHRARTRAGQVLIAPVPAWSFR